MSDQYEKEQIAKQGQDNPPQNPEPSQNIPEVAYLIGYVKDSKNPLGEIFRDDDNS